MIGAIFGDIVGSVYEFHNIKTTNFELFNPNAYFTDDTVLTMAIMDSILNKINYAINLKIYAKKYSEAHRAYGGHFSSWVYSDSYQPYNSWGNGSAMRVSSVGFAFSNLETVLSEAKKSAEVTHNHKEGIKGAQATATSIYLARTGKSKKSIKEFVESQFDYDLSQTIDEIRPNYHYDVSCQGSVPQAIRAFLDSTDFEHSIRLSISIGGDSDTIACINGGIAEAFYGPIAEPIKSWVFSKLDENMAKTIKNFYEKFM